MKWIILILALTTKSFSQVVKGLPEVLDSSLVSVDTIVSTGSDYTLLHYYTISRFHNDKIVTGGDNIFDTNFNSFSRLIFKNNTQSFNVPTIPLTHVIYLPNSNVILGLSKFAISPYHTVLYSLEGKLLYKAVMHSLELKATKEQIQSNISKYPGLKNCLQESTIIEEGDYYYLEITPCLIDIVGRESLRNLKMLSSNHHFPLMGHSSPPWNFRYLKYYDSFLDSDPLNELIMVGSKPYVLVLNKENGLKVNIPLVTDCQIVEKLFAK
jgi:hypothetical protein